MKEDNTISWSIRPEKKSINFAIFKHPGSQSLSAPKLNSSMFEPPPSPGLPVEDAPHEAKSAHNAASTAAEKLKAIGLKPIQWCGTYESNKVNTGEYDVPSGGGGMYALVFDNTFSKSHSKKVTFVLLTYPTKSPPQASHHSHHIQGQEGLSSTSVKDSLSQQKTKLPYQPSFDSLPHLQSTTSQESANRNGSRDRAQQAPEVPGNARFFTGMLQKRRRKRHQGWARRFFSLDYNTSTLSYYHDRNTINLRGAIPLSLAALGANATTRQISIDSGAEIWHLRTTNQKDFEAWKHALELANTPTDVATPIVGTRRSSAGRHFSVQKDSPAEEREWQHVEALLSKVKASRDVARMIAKDTDPKYLPSPVLKQSFPVSATSSPLESSSEHSSNDYFAESANARRPFWKRKPSSDRPMPGAFRRSVSATPSINASQRSAPPTPHGTFPTALETRALTTHAEDGIHDHCLSLLRQLDAIVGDFDVLVREGNRRREPLSQSTLSRRSIDSQDDEFFDAEGGNTSQLLDIHLETDEELSDRGVVDDGDSSSESEVEAPGSIHMSGKAKAPNDAGYPSKPDQLPPLPCPAIKRRHVVRPPSVGPPSLIGFLRKNMGKDMSTIAMPVSANEPMSLLQRIAEMLEYSELLDQAAGAKSSAEGLSFVTAFAISQLSSARVKDRAIRKPFNPMLGETFELVREDRQFRFLAEKISHRPVGLACQAESPNWCLTHSPRPSQKFWGKSAELTTDGKVRVILHSTGEKFSWTPATSFLRNVIAGEKYVEPFGTMTVVNETSGEKSVATFKAGGMFSGRSEDVTVQMYDSQSSAMPLGLVGRWTSSLHVTENGNVRSTGNPIWTVADLAPDAAKRYGFTDFAASLNEITGIEKDRLPPTDSRLRPDQRAVEDGDLDSAESVKKTLEEAQRERRKVMEDRGVEWQPQWFQKMDAGDGEDVWIETRGKLGYWDRRLAGTWDGIDNVFAI